MAVFQFIEGFCNPSIPHAATRPDSILRGGLSPNPSIKAGQLQLQRAIAKTEAYVVSRRERKKVEMLFAHLKRILRLGKLRLRGPSGAKDEFLLAATAQT
jgi:hypothetical protein